jgi:hypothetical protein
MKGVLIRGNVILELVVAPAVSTQLMLEVGRDKS